MTHNRRTLRVGQSIQLTITTKALPGGQVADLEDPSVGLYRVDQVGPTEATLVAIAQPSEPPVTLPLAYLLTSPQVTWLGDYDRTAPSSLPDEQILASLSPKKAEVVRKRLNWARVIHQAQLGYLAEDRDACEIHLIAAAAADLGVTERSVYRYAKAYRESGLKGLLDKRAKLAGARAKGGPEVFTLIANFLHRTRDRALNEKGQIREIAIALSTSPDISVSLSDSTIRRYLKLAKAELGYESTPRKRLNRKRTATSPTVPYVPATFGETVELDEQILDIEVLDPVTGSICRPRMQILWESALHVPLSIRLALAPATAIDAGYLLFDAMMFVQPTLDTDDDSPQVKTTWDSPDAVRSILDASRVPQRSRSLFVTVPRILRGDNASIYTATGFVSTVTSLGISLVPSRTYRPTDKANIERFFSTVKTELLQHLDGYVGGNAQARPTGKMGAPAKLLSITALEQIIHTYLKDVWMDTPRVGMHTLGQSGPRLSPRQALHLQMERTGFVDCLVDPYAPLGLLPFTHAALSSTMITVHGLKYSNPELGRRRDLPTPDTAKGGKYHVRYDPRDLSGIWVFLPDHADPDQGQWTYATCRSLVNPMPFSMHELKTARRMAEAPGESRRTEDVLRDLIARMHSGDLSTGPEVKAARNWNDRSTHAAEDRATHVPASAPDEHDETQGEVDDGSYYDAEEHVMPFDEHTPEWDWLPVPLPSHTSSTMGEDS